MALVTTWLTSEAAQHGLNEAQARRAMNAALGSRYNHVNVAKWKAGATPRPPTRRYMLQRSLAYCLQSAGIEVDAGTDIDQLVDALL